MFLHLIHSRHVILYFLFFFYNDGALRQIALSLSLCFLGFDIRFYSSLIILSNLECLSIFLLTIPDIKFSSPIINSYFSLLCCSFPSSLSPIPCPLFLGRASFVLPLNTSSLATSMLNSSIFQKNWFSKNRRRGGGRWGGDGHDKNIKMKSKSNGHYTPYVFIKRTCVWQNHIA